MLLHKSTIHPFIRVSWLVTLSSDSSGMPSSINDLPYETLTAILAEAAKLNIKHGPQFTYGLSQAPEPLQDVSMQRVVRGQISPDTLRWNATEAIRRVGRKWHDWALEYALESLQISRWRGSERSVQPLNF